MYSHLVSIISPTYNHEKYIAECIQSVLSQTYTNWEMIIVDDGSTDSTLSIAKKIALTDSRLKVYTQENKGIFRLSETYNFALSKSEGKYEAVLEGDDVWVPEKLTLQVESLENNQEAVLSWGQAIGSSFDLKKDINLLPIIKYDSAVFYNNPVKSALKVLAFTNHIPALTVFIRKSVLLKIGGFNQCFGLPLVDLPTWQQLAIEGSFTYIDKPLGRWRITTNQATKTYNIEMIKGVKKLAIQLYNNNRLFLNDLKITEHKLNKHFDARLVVNHYKLGMYNLSRADVYSAKAEFLNSIKLHGLIKPLWKLKSIYRLALLVLNASN